MERVRFEREMALHNGARSMERVRFEREMALHNGAR